MAIFDVTGGYNTGPGGFTGTVSGQLDGIPPNGAFTGVLTATLPNGCVASRNYSGPMTAQALNWAPGNHIESCGGQSPLVAPVTPAASQTPVTSSIATSSSTSSSSSTTSSVGGGSTTTSIASTSTTTSIGSSTTSSSTSSSSSTSTSISTTSTTSSSSTSTSSTTTSLPNCSVNVFPFPGVSVPASGATGNQVSYTIVSCSPPNYLEVYWEPAVPWVTWSGSGPAPNTPLTGTSFSFFYNVAPNSGSARVGSLRLVIRFPGSQHHYGFQINQAGAEATTAALEASGSFAFSRWPRRRAGQQ